MDLLLTCLVVLTINSVLFFMYQQKTFFMNSYNNLCTILKSHFFLEIRDNNTTRYILDFYGVSKKEKKIIEARRLQDLCLEKTQLNSKLKMLEYISVFEMYLNQNNIDKEKICQLEEFSELKLSTQKSILESTKKVSYLGAA